jgi:hypothetical protein
MSSLPAVWDMAIIRGEAWSRQFIVEDADLHSAGWEMRIQRANVATPELELTLGDGITAAYGSHTVDGVVYAGSTLVTLTIDAVTSAALPRTNTCRHAIRDADTDEFYWEGQFDIRETVFA